MSTPPPTTATATTKAHTQADSHAKANTATKANEAFTQPVPLTRPPLLLALGLAAVLLSLGFYAVASAKVTAQVDAVGVMLSGGFTLPVVAAETGQVASVSVKAGDQVSANQPVGELFVADGSTSPIITPLAGEVLQVEMLPGEVVSTGDPVMLLVDPNQPLVVTAFVPVDQAVGLRAGQPVRVTSPDASTNRPGYVPATLAGVQDLPASQQRLADVLDVNPSTASGATPSGPLREITVSFPNSPLTADQLQWEGTAPNPSPFGQGTVAKVEVITGEKSLLSVLGEKR